MNKLIATVKSIKSCDSLHLIELDFYGQTIVVISLDFNPLIKKESLVGVSIKPSNIAIGKNLSGSTSHTNKALRI